MTPDQLAARLQSQGWKVSQTRNGTYYKAKTPNGEGPYVFCSAATTDPRSVRNWVSDLRSMGAVL